MRTWWLAVGVMVAAACGGTEATAPPPDAEPAGWIYFRSIDHLYSMPMRIAAGSGAVETIPLPPPFEADPQYLAQDVFASPIDGDLSGRAKLGGLFPETFVLDAATGEVRIHGESANSFTISVDSDHRWAPDGSAVVFERHQTSGCCSVWVLLHPATGVLDTLESVAQRVPYMFGWFGPDTLLSWRPGTAPTHYRTLALATRDTAVWSLVPHNGFRMPTVSLDRQWIAHWSRVDSMVVGEGSVKFVQLRLRDRRLGTDTLLLSERDLSGPTALSESFDPESRFLAYCTTFTTIRIRELATVRTVKDLTVPSCYALSWSWGPEGPPAP